VSKTTLQPAPQSAGTAGAVGSARPTGLLDGAEHFADRGGELIGVARAADVHEHYLGLVPEEVVVQGRHLQPVLEGGVHDGVHLVFEHDVVAHQDDVIADALERGPRGQPQGRRHLHARRRHAQVGARHADLEHALLFVQLSLRPGQLFDAGRVELVVLGTCRGNNRRGNNNGHSQQVFWLTVQRNLLGLGRATNRGTGPAM